MSVGHRSCGRITAQQLQQQQLPSIYESHCNERRLKNKPLIRSRESGTETDAGFDNATSSCQFGVISIVNIITYLLNTENTKCKHKSCRDN